MLLLFTNKSPMQVQSPEQNEKRKDIRHLSIVAILGLFLGFGIAQLNVPSLLNPDNWKSDLAMVYDFTQHEGQKETDRVIIKFKSGRAETEKQKILSSLKWKEVRKIHGDDVMVVRIADDDTADEVAHRAKSLYGWMIDYAEPDVLVSPEYIPNDPDLVNEWHVQTMNTREAWDSAKGDGVTIAILDTGVDCSHPDLLANCLSGWNVVSGSIDATDVYGHGTMVAGIAAGAGDNAIQVAGIAYRSKVLPVRVSNDAAGGYAYLSDIASGVYYAADNGAKVVNISYQVAGSALISDAAVYLYQKGGLMVVSAGNDGTRITAPNTKEIIVVSGTVFDDTKATWSSYGPSVDMAAPGLGIYTTGRGGTLAVMSGTSASAPSVSGVVALLYGFRPSSTPLEISNYLTVGANDLGTAGYDESYGWGRVNAAASLLLAATATGTIASIPPAPAADVLSILSYAVTQKTGTTASISWSTSIPATGVVRYGLSQANLTGEVQNLTSRSAQIALLTGLATRTKYFYQIVATDATGKTALSPIGSLRTGGK